MTSKPKILYIITKSNWGGAQKYVFDLAINFKNEFDISVASGGNGILFEKLNTESIKTIPIPFLERDIKIWNEPMVILEILKIIKKEKPNIIHLNSPKAVLLGSIAGRIYNLLHKNKIKIIQTIHGFPFIEPRSFFWKAIMWHFSYISLLLSQKNIFVSKRDLTFLKFMPFAKQKSFYIPNGISKINFISKNSAREKLIGQNFNGVLIGTIAELNHNKGIEFLIKAVSEIKDNNIQSIVIGEGEKRKELEDLISNSGANVKLLGQIKNASEYLKAFDIFILPSLKEGLPYVLLEAGLAELPVISTKVGGIPYLIESEKSGILVPPKNHRELINTIQKYISKKDFAENCGKELFKKVYNEYNIENALEKIKNIYNL